MIAIGRESEEIEYVVPGLGCVVEKRSGSLADNIFKLHVLIFSVFDEAV